MASLSEQVNAALQVLYSPQSSQESRKNASEWLREQHLRPELWQIALDSIGVKNPGIQLWGCSILCEKIKKQWPALNEEQKTGLVQILRAQLKIFTVAKCFPLITKACISVSWVAIHSIRTNEWPGFFQEMGALVTTQITRDDIPTEVVPMEWTYLELMKALADEAKNSDQLDPALHKTALAFLRENAPHVLKNCNEVLKATHSVEVRDQAIQAINAWVELDPKATEDIFQVLQTLIHAALSYPTAISDLTHVLESIQSCLSNTSLHRYPTALSSAIHLISQFGKAAQDCVEEDDEDSLGAICSFLVYLSESHSGTMIANPEAAHKICSIVCQLTQSIDSSFVAVLSEFWQHFILELGHKKESDSVPGGIESYRTIILESIRILHERSQYTSATPSADEDNVVRSIRENANDAFSFVYSEILGDECLQLFCQVLDADLQGCVAALNQNPVAYNQRCRAVECTLFFLANLTENIPESESNFMPLILQMLSRAPDDIAVRRSALALIGSLGPWLSFQCDEHPDYAGMVASYIIPSLVDENLSLRASEAMRDLAREVPKALVPHLGGLLGAIQNTLFQMPPARRALVIQGLALVVSLLDSAAASSLFLDISTNLCGRIQAICSLERQTNESLAALCAEIRSLGQVCVPCDTEGEHPFLASLRLCWPILDQIAVHFKTVDAIRKELRKATFQFVKCIPRDQIRGILRSILRIFVDFTQIDPMNPPLRETVLLVTRFQTRPEGGMRNAEQDPSIICTNETDIADISSAVENIVRTVFHAAQEIEGFSPEAIGGMFDLIHFACKRLPDCLCRNQNFFGYVLNVSISGLLTIVDKKAFGCARRLLHGLYTLDDQIWRPMLVDGLGHGFKPLLTAIMQGIGGAVPRSYLDDLSGLLASLLSRYPNEFRAVATELLSRDGFPSANVSLEDKKSFLEHMFRNANNRDALGKILYSFSGRCLGLKSAS